MIVCVFYVYTELGISEKNGTSNYSLTNLYKDGEKILEETLNQIKTDPFNEIKGSQHGPQLVSIAKSLLKNQTSCDAKKFQLILSKIWKAASSGDTRKHLANQREKMWHEYHNLCCTQEFIREFNSYLSPALFEQPCPTLFIQTLMRKLFEKILHLRATSTSHSDNEDLSEEIKISSIEENILRYAAGFVPFSLKRQCMKRQSSDTQYDEKMKCLNAISVSNEISNPQTFLEYTKCWVEKQNRGGLFLLNNDGYLFFRSVERHCRKHFRKQCIKSISDSSDIKSPVLNAVVNDKVAMEHWGHATVRQDSAVSAQVMKMCIKLWVNIRCHAFAANWIQQFRHLQIKEAARKKALRKDLKNMKI